MSKPIPTLEETSPEFVRLSNRQVELTAQLREIEAQKRQAQIELGAIHGRDLRREQTAAVIAGVDFEFPKSYREQIGKLNDEHRVITDALHEIAIQIAEERRRASREIATHFVPDNSALAARFFKLVAEAAAVHIEHGELTRKFRVAGVDPAGLYDFGQSLFGPPGQRNNDVNYLLKDGVRRGYIGLADLPEAYR